MNRIAQVFKEKETAFITYLICGDPDIRSTEKIMHQMVKSGVDIIELGVPFTDPIADGPTIQRGVERCLQKNISLTDVFTLIKNFRKKDLSTPIVIMGYMNPINKMGIHKFAKKAKLIGVDGVLIVDLPPEESMLINQLLRENNLDQIFLASPTTKPSRLKKIIDMSSGYLYYVSLKGITGSSINDFSELKKRVIYIKKTSNNNLPITVGFGIKNSVIAKNISKFADGIIIGSSIVELIEKNLKNKKVMFNKINLFIKDISRSLASK